MPDSAGPTLLSRVRDAIRVRHYSYRTEEAYVYWIRRYIVHNGKQHPSELGAGHVTAFLSHLANDENVAAATQAQALSALLFLYKQVLEIELPWLDDIVRAKRPRRLPTVLEKAEINAILDRMEGEHALMARLMYGTGMRIGECIAIRVKDVDFERRAVVVRDGKGGKDRITVLPARLVEPLKDQLARSRSVFEHDRALARPGVALPREHHDDLHPRTQSRRTRRGEPAGSVSPRKTRRLPRCSTRETRAHQDDTSTHERGP